MSAPATTHVSAQVPSEHVVRLEELAKGAHRTRSAEIRRAIAEYLERERKAA